MHILMIHYEWPGVTDCGGSGRMTATLRERLESRGHRVNLVTDWNDHHYTTFPVRKHREIRQEIRKEPDVVFAGSTLPTAVGLGGVTTRSGIPLVVKTMGSDVHNPEQFQMIRPLLDRMNARVFDGADRIITQSQAMADKIPDAAETTLIPNGIDTDDWAWRDRDRHDPIRLLTVARLEGVKRIDLGIEAVQQLRDRGVDVEYRIVGDGGESESLQRDYGDVHGVTFTGWAEDVQQHYDWGDIFLLSSAHESFGLVLCEALACGLPVVSSGTGGQSDILAPGDDIGTPVGRVSGLSVDGIAEGVRGVADNYERLQANTEGYVERFFSIDDMVSDFESIFRSLSTGRPTDSSQTSVQSSPQRQRPMQLDR